MKTRRTKAAAGTLARLRDLCSALARDFEAALKNCDNGILSRAEVADGLAEVAALDETAGGELDEARADDELRRLAPDELRARDCRMREIFGEQGGDAGRKYDAAEIQEWVDDCGLDEIAAARRALFGIEVTPEADAGKRTQRKRETLRRIAGKGLRRALWNWLDMACVGGELAEIRRELKRWSIPQGMIKGETLRRVAFIAKAEAASGRADHEAASKQEAPEAGFNFEHAVGVDLKSFAKACGVTARTIQNWDAGKMPKRRPEALSVGYVPYLWREFPALFVWKWANEYAGKINKGRRTIHGYKAIVAAEMQRANRTIRRGFR